MRTEALRAAALLGGLFFAAACREEARPRIPPGRLARASGAAPRSVQALVPSECRAGEVFQKHDTGEAGLLVLGTGFHRGDTVFWNGKALRTAFVHSRLLAAAVPPGWLEAPGRVDITVEDTIDPSRSKLSAEFLIRSSP